MNREHFIDTTTPSLSEKERLAELSRTGLAELSCEEELGGLAELSCEELGSIYGGLIATVGGVLGRGFDLLGDLTGISI